MRRARAVWDAFDAHRAPRAPLVCASTAVLGSERPEACDGVCEPEKGRRGKALPPAGACTGACNSRASSHARCVPQAKDMRAAGMEWEQDDTDELKIASKRLRVAL